MATIGYIRVSTIDQNIDLQRNALTCANCDRIFEDRISGKIANRPGLKRANSSSEAKQAISEVRKMIDKKALIKYKRNNRTWM
ncbi:TPA: recombinase family protein [Salmonella enterica subsp. enterica]|nr:recombinase family protein [Salmonella enterica]